MSCTCVGIQFDPSHFEDTTGIHQIPLFFTVDTRYCKQGARSSVSVQQETVSISCELPLESCSLCPVVRLYCGSEDCCSRHHLIT